MHEHRRKKTKSQNLTAPEKQEWYRQTSDIRTITEKGAQKNGVLHIKLLKTMKAYLTLRPSVTVMQVHSKNKKQNTVHADSQFLTYTPKFQFQQYPHATALLVVTHVTRTQTIHSQVSSPRYSTDIESRQRAPTIRSSRRYITVEHTTTRSNHGTSTTRTLNAHHRALNAHQTTE